MKKEVEFKWNKACQKDFDIIKQYLLNLLVLSLLIPGKLLVLYITALPNSLGALLAQHNEEGKKITLYYLSQTLVGLEYNYSTIEKLCLALMFVI